jgi:hypothetical protein
MPEIERRLSLELRKLTRADDESFGDHARDRRSRLLALAEAAGSNNSTILSSEPQTRRCCAVPGEFLLLTPPMKPTHWSI